MAIDATFWVAVSFIIFFGALIYLKIPQKITEMLDKMISDIKNEIDESEKLRTDAKTLLDNAQNKLDTAQSVSSEILEEADQRPLSAVPVGTGGASIFLFVRLPDVWAHFRTYSMYRLECGLRSSAVLGFIGLPTLGFHLETAFKEGLYSEVSALLILFYLIIATMRVWMKKPILPVYLVAAAAILPWDMAFSWAHIRRFLTEDIIPHPVRVGGDNMISALGDWLWMLVADQVWPGTIATVQLTMIALVATGLLTLFFFPLISPLLLGRTARTGGHVFLVVVRSTPEYILAFVLLNLWGPSMLPAIVALSCTTRRSLDI